MQRRDLLTGFMYAGLLSAASTSFSKERKKVLLLGDSLSASYGLSKEEGWANLLFKTLPEFELVNASISGETSSGGLARLPALLMQHKPAHLVIELGANDGLRGLPLQQLKANLTRLTELGLKAGARVHIIPMELPPNFGSYSKNFAATFVDVQSTYKQKDVKIAPFLLAPIASDLKWFLPDKLHPNSAGQREIAKYMTPYFHKNLK